MNSKFLFLCLIFLNLASCGKNTTSETGYSSTVSSRECSLTEYREAINVRNICFDEDIYLNERRYKECVIKADAIINSPSLGCMFTDNNSNIHTIDKSFIDPFHIVKSKSIYLNSESGEECGIFVKYDYESYLEDCIRPEFGYMFKVCIDHYTSFLSDNPSLNCKITNSSSGTVKIIDRDLINKIINNLNI